MIETEQWSLHNVCVAVTRPAVQSKTLLQELSALGAEVVEQPAITIVPQPQVLWPKIDDSETLTVVFMSSNAVHTAVTFLQSKRFNALKEKAQFWAIGPATAQAMTSFGIKSVHYPELSSSEGLLADAAFKASLRSSVWIIQAENGRHLLAQTLQAEGIAVEVIHAYRQKAIAQLSPVFIKHCRETSLDYVVCNSVFALRVLTDLLPTDALSGWLKSRLVSGSERVIKKASEIGFQASAVLAKSIDDEAMINAIIDVENEQIR